VAINDSAATNRLIDALVAAFPSYLRHRLDEMGVIAGSSIDDVIVAAADELSASLEAHLRSPAAAQTDSPLELVRRATVTITEALALMGLRPQPRDDWEKSRYPEDLFALYPASSRDLGEEVWRLHIGWGRSKAEAVAGVVPRQARASVPAVALFGIPVDERQPIIDAIRRRGFETRVWRNPAALTEARDVVVGTAIVDLRHPKAHDAIRFLVGDGVRVVATSDVVDDLAMAGILALGAIDVIASDRIPVRLDDLLPRLA